MQNPLFAHFPLALSLAFGRPIGRLPTPPGLSFLAHIGWTSGNCHKYEMILPFGVVNQAI